MTKKQIDTENWDSKSDPGPECPGFDMELGQRLSVAIKEIGTLNKAADTAGVTAEQVRRWRELKAKMPLPAAAKICMAVGKSLDWLVFGREADQPITQIDQVDLDTMEAVIESVMRELALQEKRLDPPEFGRLCRLVYEATRDKADPEARTSLTRSALRLVSSN